VILTKTWKGEYRKVIESMEKAVEIDPEFASAYLAMSWSYGNLGYKAEQRKYLQKALELSHRLSDRERYLIQGAFCVQSEKTYDKALAALQKLIELYPDDISGNNYLGVLHVNLGERRKALEYYGAAIKSGTEDVVVHTNQANVYLALGLYEKAIEVCESYIDRVRDSAAIRRYLASVYRDLGNYERALLEVDKAFSLSGDHWKNIRSKGDVYLYMGEWEKAEEEYRKLLEKEESAAYAWGIFRQQNLCLLKGKLRNHKEKIQEGLVLSEKLAQPAWTIGWLTALSYAELRLSHPERALEELNKAWEIAVEGEYFSDQRNILREMGLLYLEMNSPREAQQTAARLKELCQQAPNKKLIRGYYYLLGMIELKKKNYPQAVELIQKASDLLTATSALHLNWSYSLGLAFYRAGDLENAAKEYEKLPSSKTGRLSGYCDLYVKSFYRMGRIYEDRGWKGKARENYQKFLDLWKEADPGIPEAKDARARLGKLETL